MRTLAHEPHPRLIVLLFNSQTMVRGLLNVLLVVASIELLGMGEAGFGWLNAALGAGALAGGLAAVGLVARRKLAGIFGIALVLWGAPIALVSAWPRAGWALVCLGIVGIGNALLDVSGFTLLQRTVDEHVLGRVFGVFEIGVAVAVAVGSLLGSVLVEQLGIRTALVVTGRDPALPRRCCRFPGCGGSTPRRRFRNGNSSWYPRCRSSPLCRRRRSSGSRRGSSGSTSPQERRSSRRVRPAIASTSSPTARSTSCWTA